MQRAVLMPLIIPLGVIGAFAVHLSHFDIYVMFTAGFAGYILNRYGFSLAPMVLAITLGPLADEILRRAIKYFEELRLSGLLLWTTPSAAPSC